MTVVLLAADERPRLCRQPRISWPSLMDVYVHPVKVAAVEALHRIGGPLSARDLWLIGVGEPEYGNVAYHVRALVDLGLLEQTHERPARGTVEKFYAMAGTQPA